MHTGRKLLSLPGHTEPIEILKFSHNGKILASGSRDGTVLLWDWNLVLRDVQLETIGKKRIIEENYETHHTAHSNYHHRFSCSQAENPSDPVNIPDEQLAGYIRRALGLEESEPITHAKIKELTELEVEFSDPFVYDLKGLDKATNLTYLFLKFPYHISDITPLAKLTKLQKLIINESSISDISPLTGLTQLTVLRLLEGYVEDLTPLAGLTKLTELNIGDNWIQEITPLKNLTELTTLYIRDNPLSDISSIGHLKKLKILYLNNNRISDLTPLASLTQVYNLTIHDNLISDLTPLANLTQLRFLSIHDNLISDLTPLNELPQLRTLHFYNNPLEDISALANLNKIEGLEFRDSSRHLASECNDTTKNTKV